MVKHYMPWFSCPHPPHAGLGVRAQNAKMTLDDGYSEQQYWLTDLKGKKVGSVPGIGMGYYRCLRSERATSLLPVNNSFKTETVCFSALTATSKQR